ncbi:MAG: hypothetical protein DWQ04_04130 [Chloroflexi bacterium]|nr:MAG: hypothetical protein DWQ04_04130 [Chloroflexota bacterium]
MEPESMVHALKQICSLLAPGGCLIDMHPISEPAPITVRLADEHHLVGWVREDSDYDAYLLADEALETVTSAALSAGVSQHIYHLQSAETFAFITYFDTLSDLRQFLADEWSAAYLEDLVAMQIESLMHSPVPDQEIIVKEIVQISLLYQR